MKYIKYAGVVLAALATAFAATSCSDDNNSPVEVFGLDKEVITVGPEGGVDKVKVSAATSWTASTEEPWILVSPASGDASTVCRIAVDSTFHSTLREGVVNFNANGRPYRLAVKQMGFEKQILVEHAEEGVRTVDLPDYIGEGKNFFDVTVTTNVDFNVRVEETTPDHDIAPGTEAKWVQCQPYELPLIASKPRTVKLRFKWSYNTKPWIQNAVIRFEPKNADEQVTRNETVAVNQKAAPEITDTRAGDSIAVLSIARQLNVYGSTFDASKSMEQWGSDIELYTKADAVALGKPEFEGRVKYVRFYMFDTTQELPYEFRYLTHTKSISIFSNVNNQLRELHMGESLSELGQYGNLTELEIFAYGLVELPRSFAKLGKSLEYLSLSNNNLLRFPSDIINPTNFPKLKHLNLMGNRRYDVHDLSNSIYGGKEGMGGELPEMLFRWDNLEGLELSLNYFEGSIPKMEGYNEKDGVPQVLPNLKSFRLNLNRLSGELPEWLLKHPNLKKWDPYILVFPQEGKDSKGHLAGFTNEPQSIQ